MSSHLRKAWAARIKQANDYRGQHQPPDDGPPLHDLLAEGSWMPDDVYEHPEWYVHGGDHDRGSIRVVKEMRGKPEAMVTIYRGAPEGATTLNRGDWVALVESYAREHGYDPEDPEKDWPVWSARVPAKFVRNGGNDLIEWGYWGPPVAARKT